MADSAISSGLAGIKTGLAIVNKSAQDIATAPVRAQEGEVDTADLAESIVGLQAGENQIEASAKVVETADEMLGTLIDTTA